MAYISTSIQTDSSPVRGTDRKHVFSALRAYTSHEATIPTAWGTAPSTLSPIDSTTQTIGANPPTGKNTFGLHNQSAHRCVGSKCGSLDLPIYTSTEASYLDDASNIAISSLLPRHSMPVPLFRVNESLRADVTFHCTLPTTSRGSSATESM